MPDLTTYQKDRLRWNAIGLVDCDTSDMPSSTQEAFREQLKQQLASRDNQAELGSARLVNRFLVRTALVLTIGVGLFWSFQSSMAARRNQLQTEFADQIIGFIHQIYEEDLQVLTSRAVETQFLLPEKAYWLAQDEDEQKMYACAEALNALQSAKFGFPDATQSQIANSQFILSNASGTAENMRLDFAFKVIAGKAGLEITDLLAQSGRLGEPGFAELRSESNRALASAYETFDANLASSLSYDGERLTRVALLTDIIRIQTRSYPVNETEAEQFERLRDLIGKAEQFLAEVKQQTPSWKFLQARLLNNKILFEHNRIRKLKLDSREIANVIERLKHEVEVVCQPFPEPASSTNAIHFEQGVCFSNLADILSNFSEKIYRAGSPAEVSALQAISELRSRAIDRLVKVPINSRTQRHFENLILNRTRQIVTKVQLLADSLGPIVPAEPVQIPAELTQLARFAELEVGGIFSANVPQLDLDSRICIAYCLPEKYSHAEIVEFALRSNRLAMDQRMNLVTWLLAHDRFTD